MAEKSDEGDDLRPATEAEAKALASAVRLRILRLCLDEPLTNKEIAERLGANPATVLHHVRKLVATGFLEAQEERLGARKSREIPYLASRKSWKLRMGDEHRSGVASAKLEVFLGEVGQARDPGAVASARLGLRLNDEQLLELDRRFKEFLNDLERQEPGPGAKPYSLFLAVRPDS